MTATLTVDDGIGHLHLAGPFNAGEDFLGRLAGFLAEGSSRGLLVTADAWEGWPAGRLRQALSTAPVPVVAAVRGRCSGEGLLLAEACHLVTAAREAVFDRPVRPVRLFTCRSLEEDAAGYLRSLVSRRPPWLVRLAVEAVVGGAGRPIGEALRREVDLFAEALRRG